MKNTLERRTLNDIARSTDLAEIQQYAQSAIGELPKNSPIAALFEEILGAESPEQAQAIARRTIVALDGKPDSDALKKPWISRPDSVSVDDCLNLMRGDSAPSPADDGWSPRYDREGEKIMERVRAGYTNRKTKAQKRRDAIDKLMENEPIGSGYSVATPSAQVLPGAGYYF